MSISYRHGTSVGEGSAFEALVESLTVMNRREFATEHLWANPATIHSS